MTDYQPTVAVSPTAFEMACKHGMELYWSDSTPKKRLDQRNGRSGFTRYVNARIEGKLAEVAFSQFLAEDYGITSQVDWRIYGDYNTTDDGDLQYLLGDDGVEYPPAVEFDVKKTKPWNQWLALRQEVYDRHPDDAPFVLTKLALEDDLIVDEWEDEDVWSRVRTNDTFIERYDAYVDQHLPLDVQIVGAVYPDEFTDEFDEGDRLYDPDTGDSLGGPLRRDNVGIHVDDLVATTDRWNQVVADIVGDNPISYEPL